MKKLKLKALELNVEEVLTREQLKTIMGGEGSGSGDDAKVICSSCSTDNDCRPGSVCRSSISCPLNLKVCAKGSNWA